MWMACAALSIIFYVSGWIFLSKKKSIAGWSSAGSLAFVALTLLMQYRMVLSWVNAEDWSALLDVVPSIFPILTGYVAIMLLANAVLIAFAVKSIKSR